MVAADELIQQAGIQRAPAYWQFAACRGLDAVRHFHPELQAPGNAVLDVQACRFTVRRATPSFGCHSVQSQLQLAVFFAAHGFRQKKFLDIDRQNILGGWSRFYAWSLAHRGALQPGQEAYTQDRCPWHRYKISLSHE